VNLGEFSRSFNVKKEKKIESYKLKKELEDLRELK
jgi:hypothetical protein